MSRKFAHAIVLLVVLAAAPAANAQPLSRLPVQTLDVTPPSARVSGELDAMRVRQAACTARPAAQIRKRIVDIAIQEWGFFGFPMLNGADDDGSFEPPVAPLRIDANVRPGGRFAPLPLDELTRVASTVAGYWSATPAGAAMIARQNSAWSGPGGVNGRWADPWSAAFISWVMCEAGLADSAKFQRSIAHWNYIDQAIQARDGRAAGAAFVAYDLGEAEILPGDLLCSGRRPAYGNLAQRRRQMGTGARTHCDIVVDVDARNARILTIGGNVRRVVSMKNFAAVQNARGNWLPAENEGSRLRPLFAHLKLRADPIEPGALLKSPTVRALGCGPRLAAGNPAAVFLQASAC